MEKKSKIIQLTEHELIQSIQSGEISVCVIGIGRIGLPTALSFGSSGLSTIGVDINEKLVDMINSGNFPLKDEPGYDVIFEKVINEKKFRATTNFSEGVNSSNVIILSLPTPMDEKNIPNYSALLSVAQQLHDEMSDGKLIVGGIKSKATGLTVTVKLALLELPALSVAIHETVVTPNGNV